jgi:NAD(P)-dependent dehydrogenase (short-subunit alcohol dehydrogenase family)
MAADALQGRICLITGAGSGIGAAVARRFAAERGTIVGVDVRRKAVEGVVGDLPGAHALAADVSLEANVVEVFDEIQVRVGRAPDVLVNVAGIGSTTTAPDTPVEVWEQVFAVNARGTFLFCKHAIPGMAALPGGGSIVNVASVAGLIGLRNRAAYCASKGAVVALTRALAVDHVADAIRVNCICPGTVDSPWVRRLVDESGESLDALRARQPMGRLGTPEEVAEAALYLASPASSFVTGSTLVIDGGLIAA